MPEDETDDDSLIGDDCSSAEKAPAKGSFPEEAPAEENDGAAREDDGRKPEHRIPAVTTRAGRVVITPLRFQD